MKTIGNDIFFAQIEELIAEGRDVVIRVKGHSMRPFMRSDRTSVRLSPCDAQRLQKGDIVLFRHHGHHVMHRITARDGERLTLAGDGNYRKVEHCTTADVVAMVSCIIDRKGRSTECGSRRWRTVSAIWTATPPLIRRCILGAMWRLGIR